MTPEKHLTIGAVRGAITVPANDGAAIGSATARLLESLLAANDLAPSQIVSAFFTATPDLDADFPAHAARRLGWTNVAMLCAQEIPVPGALPRVVRVLLTVERASARPLRPVYLEGAAALRPDLASNTAPRASGDDVARPAGAGARDAQPGRRVAIIGLGQIGGSIALALHGRGWHRVGWDTDGATLLRAMDAGALDAAAGSLAAACATADVAVIAVPVDEMSDVIRVAAASLPAGAALMDTGSVRGPVTPALHAAARDGVVAVGGHPLAGTEGHGFAAARSEMFRGAPFVLCRVEAEVPAIVLDLVADLGADAVFTDAATHDHALARTSHLPYVLSGAVREIGGEAAAARLCGPGYRDMTRLAASDPRVADPYCLANLAEIREAWDELRATIDARLRTLAG